MRDRDRIEARKLRQSGYSIREICQHINCAKSSISNWVRDIPLTKIQKERFRSNQDKGRVKAANHPNSPKQVWSTIRRDIISSAIQEIPRTYSIDILKIIGSALYWAEGYKSTVNMVSFSNSDPRMIAIMMRFFREVCRVPEEKFRGAVHLHPHRNIDNAVLFWSQITGISIKQFHKTQTTVSRASKQKRDTLPVGTFKIIICDARLQSRIKGWIEGLCNWIDVRAVGATPTFPDQGLFNPLAQKSPGFNPGMNGGKLRGGRLNKQIAEYALCTGEALASPENRRSRGL